MYIMCIWYEVKIDGEQTAPGAESRVRIMDVQESIMESIKFDYDHMLRAPLVGLWLLKKLL
jgi:hypothetical protein